jgi:hypothetical protein
VGVLVEDRFNQLDGQDTGHLPRRQDQGREGAGVFQHAEEILHRRIIVAYAVHKA